MTEKTIRMIGRDAAWIEIDGLPDEDSYLPIAKVLGGIFMLVCTGLFLLAVVMG